MRSCQARGIACLQTSHKLVYADTRLAPNSTVILDLYTIPSRCARARLRRILKDVPSPLLSDDPPPEPSIALPTRLRESEPRPVSPALEKTSEFILGTAFGLGALPAMEVTAFDARVIQTFWRTGKSELRQRR